MICAEIDAGNPTWPRGPRGPNGDAEEDREHESFEIRLSRKTDFDLLQ
jgi:hypothetical protein